MGSVVILMPAPPVVAGTGQFGALVRVYVLEFLHIKSHLVSHPTPDGINPKYNSMIHFLYGIYS